jgi:rfaE bifunctional protein nucleotidyltransferase chain/domain
VGHIRYLQAARAEGDVLVVGINSDASARKLKGEGRPILTERSRAALVAALAAVSYVILFDELDVKPLLREFQPDVHAKGTDYTPDSVPERELAALLGIRVAIVGDPKQHSTRDLLARLRRQSDG